MSALRQWLPSRPSTANMRARIAVDRKRRAGDPRQFGTRSLRRTKATLIYRRTGNLRAVGAKPGDIPIYQATKFQLLINLKTAKHSRLTLSPALLARADEMIE
jgi:hypothetical protein